MINVPEILTFIVLIFSVLSFSPSPRIWTHTTQADFMAGERRNLDVRTLDALGTPYGYDADPRGAIRLRSQPGPFSKHPLNPVFDVGKGEAWDNAVVSEAKVIFDGQSYHLWYAARQRLDGKKSPMLVGYATSTDGLNWTRHPDNPIMSPGLPGSPEANFVYPPYILFDGDTFRMWYSAHDFQEWSINYATSTDGATWEKHPANPLMRAAHDGRWDENFISEPSVLWNGERFEMWYNGGSERTGTLRVGYASSQDGLDWQKWEPDEWVLDVGPPGAWDDFSVARVHVLYDGERYQMFYEGHDGNANMSWRLGYAWSEDGLIWHKDSNNPLVDMGPPGEFDSNTVSEPYVIFDGQTYRLYYSGYDGDKYRIGLATAPAIYEKAGSLESPIVDGKKETYWGELAWTCELPEGTDIRLEVALSDDGQNWSDWQSVAESSAGGENAVSLLDLGLPASRYLRYRATLSTADPARSPVLQEIAIAEADSDFTLDVQPGTLTLLAGEAGAYNINLSPRYGFDEPVSLAVLGLPEGVVAYALENSLTLPVELLLSLSSDLASPAGTHPLTIEASAPGGLTRNVAVELILLAPIPTPTVRATRPVAPTLPPTATSTPTSTPVPPVSAVRPSAVGIGAAVAVLASLTVWFVIRRSRRAGQSQEEE